MCLHGRMIYDFLKIPLVLLQRHVLAILRLLETSVVGTEEDCL